MAKVQADGGYGKERDWNGLGVKAGWVQLIMCTDNMPVFKAAHEFHFCLRKQIILFTFEVSSSRGRGKAQESISTYSDNEH